MLTVAFCINGFQSIVAGGDLKLNVYQMVGLMFFSIAVVVTSVVTIAGITGIADALADNDDD